MGLTPPMYGLLAWAGAPLGSVGALMGMGVGRQQAADCHGLGPGSSSKINGPTPDGLTISGRGGLLPVLEKDVSAFFSSCCWLGVEMMPNLTNTFRTLAGKPSSRSVRLPKPRSKAVLAWPLAHARRSPSTLQFPL